MGHLQTLFYVRHYNNIKFLLITGLEQQTSGVGSNLFANWTIVNLINTWDASKFLLTF